MTDEHDPQTDAEPVVRTRYSSDEAASEAIVRAIAVAEGVEPTELDLLYEFVDLEALDSLLGDPVIGDGPLTSVSFGVSDYRVVVSSDGQITVLDVVDEQ